LSMYNLRAEGVQFVRRYCSACAPRAVQLARRIHLNKQALTIFYALNR